MKILFLVVISLAIASCGRKALKKLSDPPKQEFGVVTGINVFVKCNNIIIDTLKNPAALPVLANLELQFDNGSATLQPLPITYVRAVTVSFKRGNHNIDTVACYTYGTQHVGDVVYIITGKVK
jgi:hypothetical protein